MSECVFCLMLTRKSIVINDPLTLGLTKDSMGTPYFRIAVPTCDEHGDFPGIIDRICVLKPPKLEGEKPMFGPAPETEDEDPVALCPKCGHSCWTWTEEGKPCGTDA